jgi:hypothetical protein
MNPTLKFIVYIITIILLLHVKGSLSINYSNYIKNYYNIPSYNTIEYSFKNDFIENVYKELEMINTDEIIPKIYKTKLDNIILYL